MEDKMLITVTRSRNPYSTAIDLARDKLREAGKDPDAFFVFVRWTGKGNEYEATVRPRDRL